MNVQGNVGGTDLRYYSSISLWGLKNIKTHFSPDCRRCYLHLRESHCLQNISYKCYRLRHLVM